MNKDPDIVIEEAPLIILDNKYDVYMANNGKDIKNNSHIYRIVHFVRSGEKWKSHRIDWFEGGLKLTYITTNNVGENYSKPRMKYIMVSIDNSDRTLVKEGLHGTG